MSEITEAVSAETTLQPKTKISGKVLKTTLAGALIDVGQEVPGVLHISQIQKESVNKVEDVLKVGQQVDVWVRRARKDRIELTMIEPLGMEWNEIKPEMTVKGKVVRLEAYGAFVDFGAERPGMVHVSELTRGYVKTPGDVVKEGDEVEAMVLEVDRKKKQIKLSMKALMPEMIEEEKPEREGKKRGKHSKKHEEEMVEIDDTPKEPELTAMQIAWQMAMERSGKSKSVKVKSVKGGATREQEEILNRTLDKRVPTGG